LDVVRRDYSKAFFVSTRFSARYLRWQSRGFIGSGAYTAIYRRETGALVADVIEFDERGKVRCVRADYSQPSP
jgi:hypothetical protein